MADNEELALLDQPHTKALDAAVEAYAERLPFGYRDGAKGAVALRDAISDACKAYVEALSRYRAGGEAVAVAQTREAVLEEAAIDPVDNAFEQAAREWKFEQIGAEFVVNYVADRVEDFIASPESQVFHRFASRAQALRFRRRKCLEAAIRALASSPAPEPKQGEDGWIEVLRNLTNSADGLSFREDAIRNIVGNTNWRILRDHIAAARAILPAAPTSTESRE